MLEEIAKVAASYVGFTIHRLSSPEPMMGHIRRSAKASGSRKYYWTLRE